MKFMRSFSMISVIVVTLLSSTTPAQDLSATRPRRVKDVQQQITVDQLESKLAYNASLDSKTSSPEIRASWVAITNLDPAQALDALKVDSLAKGATQITGQATAGATLTIQLFDKDNKKKGNEVKSGVVPSDGRFNVDISGVGTIEETDSLTVTQTKNNLSSTTIVKPTVTARATLKCPAFDQVDEGSRIITGTGEPEATLQLFTTDPNKPDTSTKANPDGTFRLNALRPFTRETIVVVKQSFDGTDQVVTCYIDVVPQTDLTKPMLVGLAPFGIVASQQAERFSQADPFGGFVIGYRSRSRVRLVCKQTVKGIDDECHSLWEKDPDYLLKQSDTKRKEIRAFFEAYEKHKKEAAERDAAQGTSGGASVSMDSPYEERLEFKPNLNIRVQGIFEASARKASAPAAASSDTPTTAVEEGERVTFLASRKSFDINLQLWQEFRFLRSPVFNWGWYGAVGGSFPLSKNELIGEGVTAEGKDGAPVPLDTRLVESSNDAKLYYEGGINLNFYSPDLLDSKLYIQAFIAVGKYEAFADLRPEANTKWRGIGKLRVFPFGLTRDFFARGVVTPMFGVDLNAGKGPDQVKFFIGSVLNITKFISRIRGEAPTADNP